jgi:cell division protein FtsQ
MRMQNKKQKKSFYWGRFFLKGTCYFAFLVFIFFAGNWARSAWKVKKIATFKHINITVDGRHVPPQVIKKAILENLSGNFFSLNFKYLKNQLMMIAWVKDISIRRVWPDELIIHVYEQKPWGLWGTNGILNMTNQVIKVPESTLPKGLPQLNGPEGTESQVIQMYQSAQQEIQGLELNVSKLQLDSRRSWLLTLNNGITVMLGKEDALPRLMRFVHLYPKLAATAKDQQQLVYIDLRYPNGFAVKWNERAAMDTATVEAQKNTNFNRAT